MDELLALAPDGVTDSLLSLVVPLVAAGVGLVLLFYLIGIAWAVVMAVFEV